MVEKITSAPKKVVAHVRRRKTAYVATAGFIAGAVVTRKLDSNTRAQALAFIEEKGLSDEFFLPEDL